MRLFCCVRFSASPDQVDILRSIQRCLITQFDFQLRITAEQYLQYYRGAISQIIALDSTGTTNQFPAALVQRFVNTSGSMGSY
ncbi:MAG: DUF2835 family protein [Burkholderiales bacterium]|nr:DUF2835 family protein [Burkholderiales bacterium]MBL0243878.1 DUF2835 family protein [Rhodoferax sp.]